MLFSLARSLMTKNRVLPLSARGKYASRSCHIKKETKHVNETTIQGNRRWHQTLIKLILICSNRKNWKRYKSETIWNLLLGLRNLKDYHIKGAYGKRMESEFFNFESPVQTDKCLLSRDSSAKLSLLCFNTYHDLETKSAVNKLICKCQAATHLIQRSLYSVCILEWLCNSHGARLGFVQWLQQNFVLQDVTFGAGQCLP